MVVLSFRAIQIDQRPLVSFQENYEPLIPIRSQTRSDRILHQDSRDLSPPSKPRIDASFIEKLAPRPQQPTYQSPTPPPEEDEPTEDNVMDWTPQQNFRPAAVYHAPKPTPIFNEPSPFHGVIPPAPVSWAHRLRNPPNQPTFRKASETKKDSLFPAKKNKRVISDAASDVSTEFSPASKGDMLSEVGSPVKFANPRFFAPRDMSETGLESLFGDTFTLGRELTEDSLMKGRQNIRDSLAPSAPNSFSRFSAGLLLAALCILWDYASTISSAREAHIRFLTLVVAAVISATNLISSITLSTDRNLSNILPQFCSFAAVAYITFLLSLSLDNEGQLKVNALGLWYLIALTVWEVWGFVSSLATPPTALDRDPPSSSPESTTTTMHQEMPSSQPPPVQTPPTHQPLKASKLRNGIVNPSSATVTTSTTAKTNSVALSQRTTRSKSKARNESRRDSLGDGLGNLKLGVGW